MADLDYAERLKTGRNDDCPCGSKKKYKKCHLAADEAAQTAAFAKTNAEAAKNMKPEEEGHHEHHPNHPHSHGQPAAMKSHNIAPVNRQVSAPRKTGGGA